MLQLQKKRAELIDLILQALENGEKFIGQSKQGRPYKKLSNIDEITHDVFKEEDPLQIDLNKEQEDNSFYIYNQEPKEFKLLDVSEFSNEGVLRNNPNGKYFIDYKTKKTMFIYPDVDFYEKLKVGDEVVASTKALKNEPRYEATSIVSINGEDPKEYNSVWKDLGKEILSKEKIEFDDKKIYVGRRNFFVMTEHFSDNDLLDKIALSCKQSDTEIVILGINSSIEDKIQFDLINPQKTFITTYGRDWDSGVFRIVDCINYTARRVKKGKKILLIVNNVVETLRVLDKHFKTGINTHSENSIAIFSKLIELGRAYEDGASITVLMTKMQDDDDEYIDDDVVKISKIV